MGDDLLNAQTDAQKREGEIGVFETIEQEGKRFAGTGSYEIM